MIICKGVCIRSKGVHYYNHMQEGENGQGGTLYDTAMIICKGCVKTITGGALYDTAIIICKGV